MALAWLNQNVRDDLLLDLINQHHLTIDDVVDIHRTSKTKLYEFFRETYGTTPGKWRKWYWRGVHYAARFYTTAFRVKVDETFDDQRVTDADYIDLPYHEEDVPMTYHVSHVVATIDGVTKTFETHRMLTLDRWEDIHSARGKYTLSIRLTRGGRHPTVMAQLSLGNHISGKIHKPYQLEVVVTAKMVGYDNSVLAPPPKELPVPYKPVMNPIGNGAEFDLATRSVYLMRVGRQTLLLGLHEPIGDRAQKLHPRWVRRTLDNALREKIRTAFHTGEYVTVLLEDAVAMQGRLIALMDQREGVLACWFSIDGHRYLVSLEEEMDVADILGVYRGMDSKPTHILKSDLPNIARENNATLISVQELSIVAQRAMSA